jgi:hypothetical protein
MNKDDLIDNRHDCYVWHFGSITTAVVTTLMQK